MRTHLPERISEKQVLCYLICPSLNFRGFTFLSPVNPSFTAASSNGHPNSASRETASWSSKFNASNSWNYQSRLNERTQPPLKINLSKAKKVQVKKPSIGIARSKSNSSSPFNVNFFKKQRPKCLETAVRKRPAVSKNRLKRALLAQSGGGGGINGLNDGNLAAALSGAPPNSSQVPRLPSAVPTRRPPAVPAHRPPSSAVPTHRPPSSAVPALPPLVPASSSSFGWPNKSGGAGTASDDGDANVGEYAQYLELKPSVKFKCYRCGANDFGTMAALQAHIVTCSGAARSDSVSQASPVRTIRPAAAAPATSSPNLRITRQVYLCSSCGTYFQNYNLYVHMRDKHNKQICLFCRSIFARSEQLWDHLVGAHKLNAVKYASVSQLRDAFSSSFYITCCSCNSIFADDEPFNEHSCDATSAAAVDASSLCTNCQPPADAAPVDDATAVSDRLAESPRRQSFSSLDDDDDESKEEFQQAEFLSRNSTLDFIGVPEDHTLTSLPEETEEPAQPQPVDEKIDEPVAEESPPPGREEAMDGVDETATDDAVESPKLSPPPPEGSIHEPEAPDAAEASDTVAEPADEYRHEYSAAPIDDTTNNDQSGASEDDTRDVTANQHAEAEYNSPAEEPSTDRPDTSCPETEDVRPILETPPPEPVDATPAPLPMALMLDETVDSLSPPALIKECIRTACVSCLYCSNASLIAANGANLVAHLLDEHRFMPTKNEDDSRMVVQKLESGANDLVGVHMNATHSTHREITFDGTFACLQCSFTTPLFKDLCHHKRRTHHKIIFLCIMCKCNFQFYSQLLCHLCPGTYLTESMHTLKYHCCFCDVDVIPSAFRLMVHLRKVHQACDICLSRHADQSELYTHMIKQHKINHLCYKCNLAWRSRDDINKHLFWKHGTESVLCKRCLQKKWPHAYHFCIPASTYTCDECSRIFSKAVALTVHRRAHNGEFPFPCDLCEQRCISKRLLAAHKEVAHHIMREPRPDAAKEQPPTDDAEQTADQQPAEEAPSAADEGKEHRSKKKRKKEKSGNEKPLLDELPPLNLSSESEDESADEEQPAAKAEVPLAEAPPVEAPLAEAALAEAPPAEAPPTEAPSVEDATTPSSPPALPAVEDKLPEQPVAAEVPPNAEDAEAPSDAEDAEAAKKERQEVCAILNELAVAAAAAASPSTKLAVPTEEAEGAVKPAETQVQEEASPENADLIEKMLNCLIVEHSYCIPDSIFRSSDMANQSALSEGSDNAASGKRSKRDKSCSKSITPRKRKHMPKRDSSSSDSSSDTDSSSSSCGSNCSCNKSGGSNCSSSSSSESTTPEKRSNKKSARSQSKDKSSANTTGGSAAEQSLLSVPESDLDTEITVSDEDFYEEHPYYVPPPPTPVEPDPVTATAAPYDNKLTISGVALPAARNDCKSKKRKKKSKITISLGGIQRSYNVPKVSFAQNVAKNVSTNSSSMLDHRISSSSSSFSPYSSTPNASTSTSYLESPAVASTYSNCVSSTTGSAFPSSMATSSGGGDNSGRLSKRKRVKNRFYGYSSDEENSGHESLRTTIQLKKWPPSKKPKSRPGFVGIRAKRPPGLLIKPPSQFQQRSPSISSTTGGYPGASSANATYRISSSTPVNNFYRQQQQQQRNFLKPVVPESSDDSDDSDEKRHKLVINLPEKQQPNSRLSYGFSNAAASPVLGAGSGAAGRGGYAYAGSSWFNQRPSQVAQQPAAATQSTPTKKEIYCFCRCPYDEVSEMIACDAPNCPIEWFHFECVGIMAAPQGQWFCPNCRKNPENISRSF